MAKARAARDSGRSCSRSTPPSSGLRLIEELKTIFEHNPGETEVLLKMETREGTRRLRFGSAYRVRPSAALDAELDTLLGAGSRAAA